MVGSCCLWATRSLYSNWATLDRVVHLERLEDLVSVTFGLAPILYWRSQARLGVVVVMVVDAQ